MPSSSDMYNKRTEWNRVALDTVARFMGGQKWTAAYVQFRLFHNKNKINWGL